MKKFNIKLDESKAKRLREAARRRAFMLKRDLSWQDVLRDAVDQFLAEEDAVSKNPVEVSNE